MQELAKRFFSEVFQPVDAFLNKTELKQHDAILNGTKVSNEVVFNLLNKAIEAGFWLYPSEIEIVLHHIAKYPRKYRHLKKFCKEHREKK